MGLIAVLAVSSNVASKCSEAWGGREAYEMCTEFVPFSSEGGGILGGTLACDCPYVLIGASSVGADGDLLASPSAAFADLVKRGNVNRV